MIATRREFIRALGLAAASLALARCTLSAEEGEETVETPIPTSTPWSTPLATLGAETPAQTRLRACWLGLADLAQAAPDYEQGEQMQAALVAGHRAALDDLAANGVISRAAADDLQAAFVEAAGHVFRSNAMITCYDMPALNYTPPSAGQLVRQAELLADMAQSGAAQPAVVAQAQAAIARDLAFLSLSPDEVRALYDQIIQATGGGSEYPPFDELELDVTPEASEAARFLADLLLGE